MRRFAVLFAALLSWTVVAAFVPAISSPAGAALPTPHGVVPGTWQIAPTAPAPGSSSDSYNWDTCVGPTFCIAVGTRYNPAASPHQSLIGATWNGSHWTAITNFALPTGEVDFYGVSCVTPTWCMAVGTQQDALHNYVPLAESFNGSSWTIVPSPNPYAGQSALNAVSCTSTTFCEVVGYYYDSLNKEHPILQQWNGSTLTEQNAPNGLTSDSWLGSVDCIAKWCTAVGQNAQNTPSPAALIMTFSGAWAISTGGTPTGKSYLNAVSCPSTTLCMAVGQQNYQAVPVNLIEQWNGKTNTWSVDSAPVGSAAFGDYLQAVSCVGPTSCVAAGSVNTDISQDTFVNEIEAWNGSTWVLQNAPSASTSRSNIDGLACVTNDQCLGVGYADTNAEILSATVYRPGYSEVAADGGFFNFGGAPFYGSIGGHALNAPVVGMAMTPDGGGYWEVATDGGIFAYGDAGYYGSMGGKPLNKPIVGMVPTLDGRGYWLVASDGGIFGFGDATYYGSMGGKPLNKPIVGIALAPSGLGYYEVASDGGLFAFGLPGQAPFLGSTGNIALTSPIVGMAVTAFGGYYEVASDGGLFAFGGLDKAPFHGSMGGKPLVKPIVGMAIDPAGGYYEVASDGGLFNFGAPYHGSMGGKPLVEPIVGIAT